MSHETPQLVVTTSPPSHTSARRNMGMVGMGMLLGLSNL